MLSIMRLVPYQLRLGGECIHVQINGPKVFPANQTTAQFTIIFNLLA